MWRGLILFALLSITRADWGTRVNLDRPEGQRSFWVFEPKGYNGATSLPLVVWLHGLTGSHTNAFLFSVVSTAYARGYILVAGEGTTSSSNLTKTSSPPWTTKLGWNAGVCCGVEVDDVEYIKEVVALTKSRWNVDKTRVFAAGFSNGAMLTERLACETGDKIFAAYASCAGAVMVTPGLEEGSKACDASFGNSSVSYLHLHGMADAVVPWLGNSTYKMPDITKNFKGWLSRLECQGDSSVTIPSEAYSVTRNTKCRDGHVAELVATKEGPHMWWEPNLPSFLFGKWPDVDVSKYVFTFFNTVASNKNAK